MRTQCIKETDTVQLVDQARLLNEKIKTEPVSMAEVLELDSIKTELERRCSKNAE